MTVYHISYASGEHTVTGYLGVPWTPSSLPEKSVSTLHDVGIKTIQVVTSSDLQMPWSSTDAPTFVCSTSDCRLPGFVYCRGGIGRVGMVKLNWVSLFAALGHVVFAPSYRGNEGSSGRDEFGGIEREDVHQAIRILNNLPFVLRDRVNVMGFSRGAINAALSAIEMPGVHKLILWGGVSDLAATYEERPDLRRMLRRVVGGRPDQKPEVYRERSPLYRAAEIPCPTLIVHGTDDQQVNISHGMRLLDKMRQLNKPVEAHIYDGYGHHLPSPVHEAVVERMLEWAIR